MVTVAMKLKDACFLEEKLCQSPHSLVFLSLCSRNPSMVMEEQKGRITANFGDQTHCAVNSKTYLAVGWHQS